MRDFDGLDTASEFKLLPLLMRDGEVEFAPILVKGWGSESAKTAQKYRIGVEGMSGMYDHRSSSKGWHRRPKKIKGGLGLMTKQIDRAGSPGED